MELIKKNLSFFKAGQSFRGIHTSQTHWLEPFSLWLYGDIRFLIFDKSFNNKSVNRKIAPVAIT